jgi:neutral ceramidase
MGYAFAALILVMGAFTPEGLARAGTLAGFAEVPFELPDGTPLGGYGGAGRRLERPAWKPGKRLKLFRPSLGTLDPVRSKAMVLKASGDKIAFLSLDLVAISSEFREELLSRLKGMGYHSGNLMISATHTHSGPGGLSRNPFWELTALDVFQKKVLRAVLDSAVSAVQLAEAGARSAFMETTTFEVPEVQKNRRGHPDRIDPRARLILARTDSGAFLGSLILFSIHGVALDEDNLHFSSDIPGGIENAMNRLFSLKNAARGAGAGIHPVSLFISGAAGDTSPAEVGPSGIQKTGNLFAAAAEPALERGIPLPDGWSVAQTRLSLPWAGFNLRNCIREFRKEKRNRGMRMIPKGMKFKPVGFFFPHSVELTAIRWGHLILATWPGEPTQRLGAELLSLLDSPRRQASILGLTNEHLAYFMTPEEFEEGGYEACFSFYGHRGGEEIIKAQADLLDRLF